MIIVFRCFVSIWNFTDLDAQTISNSMGYRFLFLALALLCYSVCDGKGTSATTNLCASYYCIHGNCTDTSNGATCHCEIGWTGLYCETDIDECKEYNIPCQHGASCINTRGHFRCGCSSGWTGTLCQTDFDECKANPHICRNNGTCVNTEGHFRCNCARGWTGLICTTDINECVGNPCSNNGTCTNTEGGFVCNCARGWSGTSCDTDIDECREYNIPCQHGASCINTGGHFKCGCNSGWTGLFCQTDFDECKAYPYLCRNNGTCVNTDGHFRCDCASGWTGLLCTTDINECRSNPCNNNGNCANKDGGFECTCAKGWEGSTCENGVMTNNDVVCNPAVKDHCYIISKESYTWMDAKNICSTRNDSLFVPGDMEEELFLEKYLMVVKDIFNYSQKQFWIGGRIIAGGEYWLSYKDNRISRWAVQNTNKIDTVCAAMDGRYNFTWNSLSCDHRAFFICKETVLFHTPHQGSLVG